MKSLFRGTCLCCYRPSCVFAEVKPSNSRFLAAHRCLSSQDDSTVIDQRTGFPKDKSRLKPFLHDPKNKYPPVKPRYPPRGTWGKYSERAAWKFFDYGEEYLKYSTLTERLEEFCAEDFEKFCYRIHPFQSAYNTMKFVHYVTKTNVLELNVLDQRIYDINVDKEVELLEPLIKDVIVHTYEHESGAGIESRFKDSELPTEFTRQLLQCILNLVIARLSTNYPHLVESQLDENVRVEAFWRRGGFEDENGDKLQQLKGYVTRHIADGMNDVRMVSSANVDFQLRHRYPLPPIVDRRSDICLTTSDSTYPKDWNYDPTTVGQAKDHTRPVFCPGFWPGDPCMFGHTGIYTTNDANDLFGIDYIPTICKTAAVQLGFNWTLAQAYYQGFSLYHELTYPFCSQLILSDGCKFMFAVYQLNTLELWKSESSKSSDIQNVCFISDSRDLYSSVSDGVVHGFDNDVLRRLIQFLTKKPVRPDYELRPFLPDDPWNPDRKKAWIPNVEQTDNISGGDSEIYGA